MNKKEIEIILAACMLPLVLLPLLSHLAANDNSRNYANHHYGKNLLNTLEPNSIFMTEGGDNQVFTSAYNQMAEFRRPDVRIYDQKGNVFYRIYGDFRYMGSLEISIKRDIVDFEIFKRGRPVYLTWKRKPGVATCGDWFLKRYGILFKVVPLQYRFLEDLGADLEISLGRALELFKGYYKNAAVQKKIKSNLDELKNRFGLFFSRGRIRQTQDRSVAHFINDEEKRRIQKAWKDYSAFARKALSRKVDRAFMMARLRRLEKEGYLQIVGGVVRFIKDIPGPFKEDYWKQYRMDYKKVPNAVHWDYLTREILGNYAFNRLQMLRERVNYHMRREKFYRRKREITALQQNRGTLKRLRDEIELCYRDAARYGHDNGAIHNNIAILLMQKKDFASARDAFHKAITADPYMFMSTVFYMNLNLRLASAALDPSREAAALQEAQTLCKRGYTLIKGLGGIPDYRYRSIGGVAQARQMMSSGKSVYVMGQGPGRRPAAREIGIDELMQHRRFYTRVPGYSVHPDYQRLRKFETDVIKRRVHIPFSRVIAAKQLRDRNMGDFNAHLRYFQLLVQRRNMFLAIKAFEKMPEKKWARYDVFYHYGTFLEAIGETRKAVAVYLQYLKKFPNFFVAAFRAAQHLERQKNSREQALRLYTRVLDTDEAAIKKEFPVFAGQAVMFKRAAWSRGYQLAAKLGRWRQVVDIFERGDASWKKGELPTDQAMAYPIALEGLGMHRKAAGVYEGIVKANPFAFQHLFRLGRLYEDRLNSTAKAKELYRKVVGIQQYVNSHIPQRKLRLYYRLRAEAHKRFQQLP